MDSLTRLAFPGLLGEPNRFGAPSGVGYHENLAGRSGDVALDRAVRFRIGIGCLLFAWLCASGGLLDLTQAFAWGRMFSGYAKSMPFSRALAVTFDPAKRCEICVAVLDAREAARDAKQSQAPALSELGKMVLIAQRNDTAVAAPDLEAWPRADDWSAKARRYPAPVPPPRGEGADFAS